MRLLHSFKFVAAACCLVVCFSGCSPEQKQQAEEAVSEAEAAMEEAAGKAAEGAGEMMEQGKQMAGEAANKAKEMASELSEAATSYLAPLKEKLGNLDSLKDSPEKLKQAVGDMITYIEDKAADIELPAMVNSALATMKEKLVELQQYLQGEYEQSKIDEYVKGITDSVKSAFGM